MATTAGADALLDGTDIASSIAGLIAYHGELELLNAKWELASGRTVEFRLIETADMAKQLNPFKEYQRRRNGHVGQRFHGSIVPVGSEEPAYDGEVMLCGWSDSERGKTVKWWLDEEADRHPFAGYGRRSSSAPGSLFMGVFALLSDDGKAENQDQKSVAEGRGRRLSSQVHLMITSPMFVRFMTERSRKTAALQRNGKAWDTMHDGEMMTKAYIKKFLGIESLSDLDRDAGKAEMFHRTFRIPYARWSGKEHRS